MFIINFGCPAKSSDFLLGMPALERWSKLFFACTLWISGLETETMNIWEVRDLEAFHCRAVKIWAKIDLVWKIERIPRILVFLGISMDWHLESPQSKFFSLQPLPGCLERSIRHAPHPKCQSGPGAAGRFPTALRVLGEYHRSKQEIFQPMFDCRGWRDQLSTHGLISSQKSSTWGLFSSQTLESSQWSQQPPVFGEIPID